MELTPAAAAALPPRVRMLCGFEMHRDLGFFDDAVHQRIGEGETEEWLQEWREAASTDAAAGSGSKL